MHDAERRLAMGRGAVIPYKAHHQNEGRTAVIVRLCGVCPQNARIPRRILEDAIAAVPRTILLPHRWRQGRFC